jgi:hypothetical protein
MQALGKERFSPFAIPEEVEAMSDDCLSSTGSVMASSRADTRSGNSNRLEILHLYTLQDLLAAHHAAIGTAEIIAQSWDIT